MCQLEPIGDTWLAPPGPSCKLMVVAGAPNEEMTQELCVKNKEIATRAGATEQVVKGLFAQGQRPHRGFVGQSGSNRQCRRREENRWFKSDSARRRLCSGRYSRKIGKSEATQIPVISHYR